MGGTFVQGLTFRYIAVLVGLATLIVAGNFIIDGAIESQKTDAAEINIAGRQRMYSQKIVLLGLELDRLEEGERRRAIRQEYEQSLNQMASAHEALISGNPQKGISPPSEVLKELYFGPKLTIDADVRRFIAKSKVLLELHGPDAPPRSRSHDHQGLFVSLVSTEFLAALDKAVAQYQRDSEGKLKFLSKLNNAASLTALFLLAISAIAIFAPVAKRLNQQIQSLKETEESLLESEKKFRDFTEAASDWVWETDNEHKFIKVSDQFFKKYEIDPSTIYGETRWGRLAGADLPRNSDTWASHKADMENGRSFARFEYPIVDRRGKCHYLSINGKPIFGDDGTFLGYRGSGRDVTTRYQAQEQLRRKEKSLAQAQQLAHIGSWQWDPKTEEVDWSDELLRFLQLKPGTFTPTLETLIAFMNPDDGNKMREAFRRAFLDPNYQEEVEVAFARADGSTRFANVVMVTEFDREGNPISMTGSVQDITERKAVEALLLQAKEKAEQANKAKSDFLSSMSHELRTPLNAILGFGQVLQMDERQNLSGEQQTCVEQIVKGGQLLLELIDEILDLAKIEAGKLSLSLETVEIRPLIEGCEALISSMAQKKQLTIDIFGEGDVSVMGDYTRLRQVLLNLMSNAVKYNRDYGRVSVNWWRQDDGKVKLSVSDTGTGIPAVKQAGLFEPFNRLGAESLQIEGTGIGLTIAKRLIEAMGGDIGFETEEGVGSTFWVVLPGAAPSMKGLGTSEENKSSRSRKPSQTREGKVLYVEDNPANLKLVGMVIKQLGMLQMISASDAETGIDLARSERPDVILMDINLPGIDGFQALDILKSLVETKDTPVVAVSAAAMKGDIKRGLDAGFQAYVSKPLDVGKLLSVLKGIIH